MNIFRIEICIRLIRFMKVVKTGKKHFYRFLDAAAGIFDPQEIMLH